jgi:hypothetical protein
MAMVAPADVWRALFSVGRLSSFFARNTLKKDGITLDAELFGMMGASAGEMRGFAAL